eukprot:TRINITY_DN4676_c0_g1_i1.p1 TRINITY_DN4676_c0_g1~~TRINITY_DN4676_c0_g1_i1.p1  ORF type:complete len:1338 (-),score=335.21 TRINITY_DN4676_c0_g1_i1:47-4060(-)
MSEQVIVVGGGLAGLSAAHTVLERGFRVLVLDKNPFLGGNSTKATSGINGALTRTQKEQGVQDSAQAFYDDTALSARDLLRPGLVKVLTFNSASAVEWLQDKFGLDLSLLSRLGGHSFPRTHRGKEKFPGMTITYALMEKLEDIATSQPEKARILKKAKANRLIEENGKIVGVEFEHDSKVITEYGPVILATGGYAADFSQGGLIQQYRPDIFHLPTTNGDHSTGDGIKMVRQIGGNTIDLEKVQVHPTGLVDPNEPDAKVKFLAAEALRGEGGILLDANGKRFCDELGHRDYVTGMMNKNKGPFRLVLNKAASEKIGWHCKHYMGRGLMKHFSNGEKLASEMGISSEILKDTFKRYNASAEQKKDEFGKKYYHNVPFDFSSEFHVAIVTPVVHYCMGGIEINPAGEIVTPQGNGVPGLFGAGEVAGGVHGANRLGGSSLLGCVVFGRVAGESAADFLKKEGGNRAAVRISNLGKQISGDLRVGTTVSQNGVETKITLEPQNNKLHMEISWNSQESPSVSQSSHVPRSQVVPDTHPAPVPKQAPKNDKNREISMEEVAKHNTENDCWVVVNGQVLDVSKFLPDHPGGKKAILIYAGKDASAEFNMLHKPDVVEKYAPESIIGRLAGTPVTTPAVGTPQKKNGGNLPVRPELRPGKEESDISGGTAGILPMERKKSTFDAEKLTNYFDGGAEKTKRRRWILAPIEKFDVKNKHNLDLVGHLREHVGYFMKIHEPHWDTYVPTREEGAWMSEGSVFQGSLMNHYGLFLPTIELNGSDEQRKWWSQRAKTMQIIGSYAQTELGHGSNVRGLRTIAEYDAKTQEFILNTPTLRSMKWWPGTLGKVATHAIVYAQLILNGKEYGVHSFMVQIRDENHLPLSGIELGDLGPKLGDHANDTGYMRMKDVRIPREFMLAKYQQVLPNGEYVKSADKTKNSKLHYTTMIFTRGSMVKTAGGFLSRAVTIGVRYGCVREQGFVDTTKKNFSAPERQIIDYQVQRFRLFKPLADAYAIRFTGSWMLRQISQMESTSGSNRMSNVDILPEIAASSGGLKGLCTFLCWKGIEDVRKCCGGNGYLMSAGLAPLAANYVWQTTAEGDFILLQLSTALFLLKSINTAVSGGKLPEICSYLADIGTVGELPVAGNSAQFADLDFLQSLFKRCALLTVSTVGQIFSEKLAQVNGHYSEAFNLCSLELVSAVKSHCYLIMVNNFIDAVRNCPDAKVASGLADMCVMFCLSCMIEEPQWNGLFSTEQLKLLKACMLDTMEKIRPNAIAFTDAFDFSDRVLGSTIGGYEGNVYEALYSEALESPLNQTDPFDGYQDYLRPHLDLEFLKVGNKVAPSKM